MIQGFLALFLAAWMNAMPASAEPYPWPRSAAYVREPAVLIFSKTRDWRHESGIPAATHFVVETSSDLELSAHSTEDARIFSDEALGRFDVVVFNNMTGNGLNADQQAAFERWVAKGGGVLAIHGAGDGSQENWRWYLDRVIGAKFTGHPMAPQFQDASIHVLAREHPVTVGLPNTFVLNDEWYAFAAPPGPGFIPLLGLDESSYEQSGTTFGPQEVLVMGPRPEDHPIAWATCVGEGRVVYSSLGHRAEAYQAPLHRTLLRNALRWVAGQTDLEGSGCP